MQSKVCEKPRRKDGCPRGSIGPGLLELGMYVTAAVAGVAGIIAGSCVLGCGVAWLAAGGPDMPAAYALIARTQGIVLGLGVLAAGLLGYRWGAKAKREKTRW